MGLTNHFKMRVGIEFEKERGDDPGSLDAVDDFGPPELSELGSEVIFIPFPRQGDGTGMGIVTEIELPLGSEEPTKFIVGAIFELQSGPWLAAAVPTFVRAIGGDPEDGERVDDKWDFAYATQLSYGFSETWTLALEGYGTMSESEIPVAHPNRHGALGIPISTAGPVLYYTRYLGFSKRNATNTPDLGASSNTNAAREDTNFSVGLGFLVGLNDDTPKGTLKVSIEIDF